MPVSLSILSAKTCAGCMSINATDLDGNKGKLIERTVMKQVSDNVMLYYSGFQSLQLWWHCSWQSCLTVK